MILTVTVKVSVKLPDGKVEDEHIQEWLEYELGEGHPVQATNPLLGLGIDIRDISY